MSIEPAIESFECDVCGCTPCQTPRFCEACRDWPEPDMRLIGDDRAPPPALEDDALPAGWGAWITGAANACSCPRDYIAAALIAAASAWIGNARRIAATADWIEPVHLWFALIGPP